MMGRPKRWLLWILVIGIVSAVVAGCAPPVAGEANNVAPAPFLTAWRACGGASGAGEWLAGPFWFQGNLVGVARNMIFVWRADAPQGGARPFQVHPSQPPVAEQRQGFVYKNGHNVVPEIATWIRNHGGWRCAGLPMSEPFDGGGQTCQVFANMLICRDADARRVRPQPIGRQFLRAKGEALKTGLPSITLPGWQAQITAALQSNDRQLQIQARVASSNGAPCEALAVQIDDVHGDRTTPIYYNLIAGQTLPHGVWEATVSLPKLAPGKHTLVTKVCAVGPQGWLACAADSVLLKVPEPQK